MKTYHLAHCCLVRCFLAHCFLISVIASLITISACTPGIYLEYTRDEQQALKARVLGLGIAQANQLDDILALSPDIKAQLDRRINKRWGPRRKMRELRRFIYDPGELNIIYNSGFTKTATETFNSRSGNCLSQTNLFIAAGRHIGIDAHFQTVKVKPSWDQEGMLMIRYKHIVATGRLLNERYVMDFLPEFSVDNLGRRRISDQHAAALYYNNLGVEHLVAGEPTLAIEKLRRALHLNRRDSDSWNNIGAAFRRVGEQDLAEYSYVMALRIDGLNYSTLANIERLYLEQGRDLAAKDIKARVERYRSGNPYHQLFVANSLYQIGRIEDAIRLLERAIRIKKDEPKFYELLASAYASLGDLEQQQALLEKAALYRQPVKVLPRDRRSIEQLWKLRTI